VPPALRDASGAAAWCIAPRLIAASSAETSCGWRDWRDDADCSVQLRARGEEGEIRGNLDATLTAEAMRRETENETSATKPNGAWTKKRTPQTRPRVVHEVCTPPAD
jgi:hypothetical protein